jgi:hypothetical protein
VVGPTATDIGEANGLLNFAQVVVVDPDNTGAPVYTLDDGRLKNTGSNEIELEVNGVTYEKDYEYLLLMGYWERKYTDEVDGNYVYNENALPTLLAAGYTKTSVTYENRDVQIFMFPLEVDTKLKKGSDIVETQDENGIFPLTPGNWDIEWTVNSFYDLDAAQKGELFNAKAAVGNGAASGKTITVSENVVTLNLGTLTAGADSQGSANFNLKYVPFSLNSADTWSKFTDQEHLNQKGGEPPAWIIRNGINDTAQNANTDFSNPQTDWKNEKNGNGAVAFSGPLTGDAVVIPVFPKIGAGDNATIEESNLLNVLGAKTVAAAIESLHQRLNRGGETPYLDGLKVGMYLDLTDGLNDGNAVIPWNASNQNLRIVIASFNQYKNGTNTKNHIKFVFKNIPVEIKMSTVGTNAGGYPASTLLKPYLEGSFLTGLKAALGGRDYFYPVTRPISGGSPSWDAVDFTAAIFIDTEKEVFGTNTSWGDATSEDGLTQTALYDVGGETWWTKKFNGSVSDWWLGSPSPANGFPIFCTVDVESEPDAFVNGAFANNPSGVAPAFCIY